MTDVEEAELRQRLNNNNGVGPQLGLHPRHPVNLMYRAAVILGSLYGLHMMEVFHKVLRGPDINHEWFKLGLAATIAISMIKAYMEMFEGRVRKQKVDYQNYKNATHSVMILFLLASVSFHISLWEEFGGLKTLFINFLFGYGVLLQLCLLFPTWVQNVVAFIGLTFFLQQYN
jgi:hypothetical protein